MAVTVNYYNDYFEQQLIGTHDWDADSYNVMLLDSGYSFNKLHDFRDDVTADEVVGTGYSAGGIALTGITVTQDDTNDRAIVDFDDPEWTSSTITARHAVIYKDVGTAATDNLVCDIDFGADFSSSSSTFRIEIDPDGFQALQAA